MNNIEVKTLGGRRLKAKIKSNYDKRLPITDLMIAASLLDPTYRDEFFITQYLEKKKITKFSFLKTLFSKLKTDVSVSFTFPTKEELRKMNLYEQSRIRSMPKSIDEEIKIYLDMENINLSEESVLSWWMTQSNKLKRLSLLAKKYLGLAAMSSDVESNFSIMGCIVTARRSSLSTVKTEKIIFFKQNMNFIN